MNNKQILFTITLLTLCQTPHIINGAIIETIATKTLIDSGKYVVDYYYSYCEEDKATLNRNLENHKPTIQSGCEKNFTANCHSFAEHCKKAEEYYKIKDLQEQLTLVHDPMVKTIIEEDLKEALVEKQKTNVSDENRSYFESLSSNDKNELLKLMRTLIKEHRCENNYANELNKMHKPFNR